MLRKTTFHLTLLTAGLGFAASTSWGYASTESKTAGRNERASASAIRAIPWKDRTYDFGDGDPRVFTKGKHLDLNDEGRCNVCISIRSVTFGDIDGDGQEEALVTTATSLGGAGVLLEGFIYGLKDGEVVLRSEVESGDRGDGGIESMTARDGDAIVRRYRLENPSLPGSRYGSTCCPNWIEVERWHWDGSKLVKVSARFIRRAPRPWTGPSRHRGR